MQHAAQAYKKVANETSTSRELEANLLLKSAARIQSIRDGLDGRKSELGDALLFNRKLWTIFLDSILRDDNPDRKSTRLNSSHTVIYTLSLHDALPIYSRRFGRPQIRTRRCAVVQPQALDDFS